MKTKQILLKSFTFLISLTLLLGDVSVASAKKKKKKGKKSGKSSKSSGKKNVAVNDPQPSSQSQIPDARAGYANNMAGYARGRGAGQPQQQMTPEQEIENLTGKLMACLSPVCNGSISYEKCFQTSKLDLHFASVPDCVSFLNAASSEDIKVTAKNKVKEKIKGYLKEACNDAGGSLKGERCKFEIFYYAKSPDGKHNKKEGPKTYNAGQMLTCSYSDFGLSESDLQYELEMDAATKGELIKSGLEMGTGVFQGGMKIFQASKKKKELETAEKGSKGCYIFNGSTLTRSGSSCPSNDEKITKCEDGGMLGYGKSCYYVFEKDVSKIDIQEKTAELIRSKVNIGALKQMANNEDRIRELKNLQAILGAQKVDAQGNTDTSSIDNLLSDIKKEQKALAEGKSTSGSTNADYASRYSAAVSSYNSNQGALNKSKEELENAGKDMQAGISDITKGMLGGGSTLVTNLMAAKENKGTMTGNCYLGDPEGGGTLFAPEGETKKISWQ